MLVLCEQNFVVVGVRIDRIILSLLSLKEIADLMHVSYHSIVPLLEL